MKLTEPQRWALQAIKDGHGTAPNMLGMKMMERPGATTRPANSPYASQGYGRMGGTMMERLKKKGLVYTTGWPTRAILTDAGRRALSDAAEAGQ